MSPLIQDYHIYADETLLHGPVSFAFGALICTPRRAEILSGALTKARDLFGCTSEIKWNKTSHQNLEFYQTVLNIFLDDKFARVSIFRVIKGHSWQQWAQTEEERFFKTYYVFLMRNIGPSSRYTVYLDTKSLQKPYRWDRLHFLINRARRESWGLQRKNVRFLSAVDSRSKDLLQLADLLLGCLTSTATAAAKTTLRAHLQDQMTAMADRKIQITEWTPPSPEAR